MESIIHDIKRGNLKRVAKSDFHERNSQPDHESMQQQLQATSEILPGRNEATSALLKEKNQL